MTSKGALRARFRHSRSQRRAADLTEAEEQLAIRVLARGEVARAGTVAVYLSTGTEPPTWRLVDALRERGGTVLAPVMTPGRALDWAEYTGRGELQVAAYGIPEPSGQRLGPDALAGARAVVLPALAVDPAGHRLGRGAGYYDRALAHADPSAIRIALVFDDEFVEDVPAEAHDEPVHLAVTPARTLACRPGTPG